MFITGGTPGVKTWSEAQIGIAVPLVLSYISPFVHSYNPNYTVRLISPTIIGILSSQLCRRVVDTENLKAKPIYITIIEGPHVLM